ncbi:MAG: M48 family metallopeptidase [Rhizobiaceae bacterium]|nr:M48 family metallopeptidase [Rhizobiaceae bacterium]
MPFSLSKLLARRPAKRAPASEILPQMLELSAGTVPLVVRRNPRAKRLIMRLSPGARELSITAPPRVSAAAILDFIERHKGWAESRIVRAEGLIEVADGAILPFRGGTLRIVHEPGRRGSRLDTAADALDDMVLRVGGDAGHLPRRVTDALKREARRDLQAAVDRHSAAVGLQPSAMTLKDTRSRWGSCSADRRLSFSWRIVMAPPEVLDYLVAHEVAHFRQMNHAPAFWSLCRALCPGMDEGRAWLKRHGASLHAIRFG